MKHAEAETILATVPQDDQGFQQKCQGVEHWERDTMRGKAFCSSKDKSKFQISDLQRCDFHHEDFFICADPPGYFCLGSAQLSIGAEHRLWGLRTVGCKSD